MAERGNGKGVAIVENPKKEASCPLPNQNLTSTQLRSPLRSAPQQEGEILEEREEKKGIFFCIVNVVCDVVCWGLVLFCLGLCC